MGFPFGLIVTNPIDKRLIDLLSDCLVDLESWRRLRGTQGHRASERKAQSLYDDFSPKTRELKERGIRKNLKAADKKSDQIFQRRLRCEQKGSAYGSLCVSMFVCVCVSVWKSEWAPGLGSMCSLFRNWQSWRFVDFFCCCCFFFYELKRENEFENERFSVHFSNRVNEGGKLTPTLNEHLLYTQVLTLQLLWLAMLCFSRLNTSCHPLYIFRPTLVWNCLFHWTYSRKQALTGCNSGHKGREWSIPWNQLE